MDKMPNREQEHEEQALWMRDLQAKCSTELNLLGLNLECSQKELDAHDKATPSDDLQTLRTLLSGANVAYNRVDRILDQTFRLMECTWGELQPERTSVDLCELLRGICAEKDAIQASMGVTLAEDLGENETLYLLTDREMAEQILLQLLSNALRAVEAGGQVQIKLTAGQQIHTIHILDDGCGLAEFAAEGANRARFVGSAKLGLRICRAYCDLLGWDLTLQPREQGGTEAILRIPADELQMFPNTEVQSDVWTRISEAEALSYAVRRELHSVPALESVDFNRKR